MKYEDKLTFDQRLELERLYDEMVAADDLRKYAAEIIMLRARLVACREASDNARKDG